MTITLSDELYRIAKIGAEGDLRYISGNLKKIRMSGPDDALHWHKREATTLVFAFNKEFARLGRSERFQTEKVT